MPQVRRPPVPAIVFFFFLVWLFVPGDDIPVQSLLQSDVATERLERYHGALDTLNQSHWGDFSPKPEADPDAGVGHGFLNLTGFRGLRDGFAWEDFDLFRERGLELSHYAVPSQSSSPLTDGTA